MKTFARAVLAAFLAAACTPPTVTTSGPSPDDACNDLAYDRCGHLQTCSPTAVLQRYGSESACETAFKENCLGNILAPSSGSTAASNEACAQAIQNWPCTDFLFTQNPPPECETATGQLPSGSACAFSAQCQSSYCSVVPGSNCGVCASLPRAGDPCDQLVSCGVGMTCTSDTKQCQPFGVQDSPCGRGLPCLDGLGCVGASPDAGVTGTCQLAEQTQGAACEGSPGCDFYSGLTCNLQNSTCAPVQLVGDGQPCGFLNQQGVSCMAGACLGASGPTPGMCQAFAQMGGACDLVAGPACASPARCITADGGTAGTCGIPNGAACH
jgi:hypothetical protein